MARLIALFSALAASFLASLPAHSQTPDIFPVSGSAFGPSKPVVAELDGDATNGKEIVVATADGYVEALSSTGRTLWSVQTPNFNCSKSSSKDKIYTSPVVGDLFGTGEQYVVIGYGGLGGKTCDGGVAVYRGLTGEVAWTFSIKSWAKRQKYYAPHASVYGTPALADVDGDGKLEIGFGSLDRNVYLLNSNGRVRWYYNAADTVFSSPAFANVAGNSDLEMIIGTDISKNARLKPPTRDGGYLYAFKAGISVPQGTKFGFRNSKIQQWRTSFDQVIQASPVVADLIPSSPGLEVVTGSGCFFPQGAKERRGRWYRVVSGSTGKVLRTLTVPSCSPTTAAVGDLDQDGTLEVVVAVNGAAKSGRDDPGQLIAWRPASNQVLWGITPLLGTGTDSSAGSLNRVPVIQDLNRDGFPEVALNYRTGVVVVAGRTGEQLTCDSSPCTKPNLRTDSVLQGSPAIADIEGDGVLDILVLGRLDGRNGVVRWRNPF